jgi:flagellar biosynthesis protein FlhB
MPHGERTEQPTATRLQRARTRGLVAHSRDLTSACVLAAAALALAYTGADIVTALRAGMRYAFAAAASADPGSVDVSAALASAARGAGTAIVPLALVLVGAAILGPLLQIGPLLTSAPFTPEMGRINPAAGIRRVFVNVISEPPGAVLKVLLVAAIFVSVLTLHIRDLAVLSQSPAGMAGRLVWLLGLRALGGVVAAAAALGALDLILKRRRLRQSLRMTREEVQRERREEEGDPTHRAARRRLREEVVAQQLPN